MLETYMTNMHNASGVQGHPSCFTKHLKSLTDQAGHAHVTYKHEEYNLGLALALSGQAPRRIPGRSFLEALNM